MLSLTGLPPFSLIKAEHAEPAIDAVLEENRSKIKSLLNGTDTYTWENLIEPLGLLEDRLGRIWSPVRHMNSVVNNDALRDAYNACLPKLSEYGTELGQNQALYQAYQSLVNGPAFDTLDTAQQKILKNALLDFHLSGVDLPEDKKQRFKAIQQELSQIESTYEENLLDATHAWSKLLDEASDLRGLPESSVEMAAQNARTRDQEGWLLNLEFPSYYAVMTYAEDRGLREEVYTAYVTRASDVADHPKWDNSDIMDRILALRHEAARLLGYANYAEKSLVTKMADSPAQVLEFLRDLARRSRPAAERDLAELKDFAAEHLGLDKLEAWDIGFASERLRQHRFDISQEDLKPYFPVDQVLKGLFDLVGRLYDMQIEAVDGVDTWHPDVRFYEIRDIAGTLRGQFYLDLYARSKKRGGAWMDECINRLKTDHGIQTPVAYMTCNSSPPVGGKPALFTHDEVITLFHEFGHGLHHMLTLIDYPDASGINGVEWDAVELPSQFMENWCWEREALDLFAAHYQSGERLPDALYEKLMQTKHFQAGMMMLRQIEFALFDLRIHLEYDPERGGRIQAILDEVRDEVAVLHPPAFNRFQHGFSHIFAGGYAAGYYSYKWAEVLSADAFARFEEEGLFNKTTGEAFLHGILEQGGSRPAMELFKGFRGREPAIDALLRHNGLAA